MKKIMNLCEGRGYIYPGSQIYGGLANSWDYGPLGVELKNNIQRNWWRTFIQKKEEMVGIDSAILMHPKVWESSGHLKSFQDPLVDCKSCQSRYRGDDLIIRALERKEEGVLEIEKFVNGLSLKGVSEQIKKLEIKCPNCGGNNFTDARGFNLMFKTYQGVLEEEGKEIYLRPETAQGIFTNFKNILRTERKKLPFGVGQIGKSFRNEITPGNFLYRTREFEQMELEYFIKAEDQEEYFNFWVEESMSWFQEEMGLDGKNLRIREHGKDELSHYSKKTVDIEYHYPFGWGELAGIACRGNFDLGVHSQGSLEELKYRDLKTGEDYFPCVIEPSFGLDRTFLTCLIDSYREERLEGGKTRTVLNLPKKLCPIEVAIFPLKKNEVNLVKKAKEITKELQGKYKVKYDDTGSIGKLYRRQDEIGTPFCITVDFGTIGEDEKVTVRERETMKQMRIGLEDLEEYFSQNFGYKSLEKAIKIKPDDHDVYNNMGNAYYDLKEYKKAIECYKKAIELKPDYYDAHYNMGNAYDDLKEYEKAIECYKKAIELKPDDHDVHYNMGNAYYDLKKYGKAIECYEKALEIEPYDRDPHYNMGNAYYDLKEYEKAIDCYEKAIELKPGDYDAYNNMGLAYAELGKPEKAIECYKKAIKIKMDYHDAYNNMGNAYNDLGQHEKAIECSEEAIKIKPGDQDVYKINEGRESRKES